MDTGHVRIFVACISLFATGYAYVALLFLGDTAPHESRAFVVAEFFSGSILFALPVVLMLWFGTVIIWGYKRPPAWLSLWDIVVAAVPLALLACLLLTLLFPGTPL